MSKGLYCLVLGTTLLTLGHHVDHVVRGNHSGWPFQEQPSPFTFSLAVYPVVVLGLYLSRRGKVGPGYWAVVWSLMTLLAASVHLPLNDDSETPSAIIDPYSSPVLGWFWFVWLLVTVGAALTTTMVALRLWMSQRQQFDRVRVRTGDHGGGAR